jgi:hypothetical protein
MPSDGRGGHISSRTVFVKDTEQPLLARNFSEGPTDHVPEWMQVQSHREIGRLYFPATVAGSITPPASIMLQ